MPKTDKSQVIIESAGTELRSTIEDIMSAKAPKSLSGSTVLIKPNMVGPSEPELGHTTNPELVRAVVLACLDRGAKVIVGDNPGGVNRNSRNVAKVTGILDASEGCFAPISERVVEFKGAETGFRLIISKAVLDADYIINIPKFKTHLLLIVTGAIKNLYGYVAGACKAQLHLDAAMPEDFAKAICDIYEVRPPDLNIMDAITVIEGNGPCHGGRQREVGKLLASTDALALDCIMAKMMGAEAGKMPVQEQARIRGFGNFYDDDIETCGELETIPDFKMPITYFTQSFSEEQMNELIKLYPPGMMITRTGVKPLQDADKCIECGDCADNCPAGALTLEPEFSISEKCITCFCCVELCTEGALEVPDIEAFHHY